MNSVTMVIDQHVPDDRVATETVGYDITCQSSSTLRSAAVWGVVVNVTVDKLLPNEHYTCNIAVINKHGTGKVATINITTLPSG